jgi:hypothetical protein
MHRRTLVATATCLWWLSTPAIAADRLINGTPAVASEWPASVVAAIGSNRCSATIVGPRTLLIAAHCLGPGVPVRFAIGASEYSSRCTRHPAYPAQDIDVALCQIDREVTDVPYENVLVDADRVTVDQTLLLTGYGCNQMGGHGGNDGVFRIGEAKVIGLPQPPSVHIVTRGAVALCFGDSGGGAYLVEGERRVLVGVNSKGNLSTDSYLAATFDARIVEFFQSWTASTGERVCGLHDDVVGCRVTGPSPAFRVDSAVATGHVRVKPAFLDALDRVRGAVEAAIAP